MSFLKTRIFFCFGLVLGLVGCGGSLAPVAPTAAPQTESIGHELTSRAAATVELPLSARPGTFALASGDGNVGTITFHSRTALPGATLSLRVARQTFRRGEACRTTIKIALRNRSTRPVVIDVDGFTLNLPCTPSAPLFGVTLYPIAPIVNPIVPIKLGDVRATGKTIVFTSNVVTVTLAPKSESEIAVIPEDLTTEVGIPIVPGTTQVLTANAPQLPSSLTMAYGSAGGGGTLYSSACAPAFANGVLAPALAHAIIEGIPSFYCTLGTVDSASILFGAPTVSFTIGAPIPDRSFIALDGPASEFACDTNATPTCVTPEFTVPTITNVIAGNVLELQSCVPARENTNCNSNENPAPAPSATSVAANHEVQLLVSDDPTYVSPGTASCSGPAICGGFVVDTSGGSCSINNGSDANGDVPPSTKYKDPGGPQEFPPANGGRSTKAYFPAVGPDVEFDLVSGASGTTCIVAVTEADGPLQRTVSLQIPVR